jgi:hypothetical protein
LIVGKSTHISAADRVKVYTDLAGMVADGFITTDAEYKAAQKYFSQSPKPTKVAIGRWDGTGAETAAEAVAACRAKNTEWYACTVCGAVKADVEDVAEYIEACTPESAYFYTTEDADVLAGTAGNIFDTLMDLGYKRSFGQYSTVDDGVAGIMGYAMGANTGLANSAYDLFAKKVVGITTEDITQQQFENIINANGNVYVSKGSYYDMMMKGNMANGTPFDEVINLDMLSNNIQKSVVDTLVSLPKVPQTDGGVSLLVTAVTKPCDDAKKIGFIAPGIWNGPQIMDLSPGDALSNGFMVISDSLANQSQADRDARKAPPIYVPIKLAGSVRSVIINVIVNR